ncbi:molybdopterin cofactor-binding domain-containing protein [Actibacterium sp. MT2.3-13A]|uniref:xanthine dehydrogenase family protein molybdopterin-binding subunit n=1 Tax=Actibacterium sp. MT2.3-13A TaxID=2828332 RepID=UPI001BAD07B1|nr:molybdopterin cofactor-binding domain-containing protein [Actibacterium sp. MT2.3-13A]
MSRIGRPARRSFLIGSAAVAGGVAFGYYRYRQPLPNPLLEGLAEGEAALTPFVRIDAQGVTLITPRADMGQGASSIQAYLLAEGLDLDPLTVRLDPGDPSPAYYNGAVLAEGLPFAATDTGWLAETARAAADVPARLMGMQITGGSSTVPDMFDRLRHAGAVARETLKEAAAQQTGIARDRLGTDDGAVILPDGQRLPYGALAARAATLEPVTDAIPRPASAWRYLGKRVQRTDIVAKSTGTETYGIDLALDGMLYASVRTNPGLGGAVNGYDASAAEAMRGVLKVVPVTGGVGVIADNTWRAFRAVNAIAIDWGAPGYPASSDQIWPALRAAMTAGNRDSRFRDEGDVENALFEGEAIAAEYRVPYLAHAPLEPMNATVRVTDSRADIWTGTQIPRFVQTHAARLTGLDEAAVHVHALPMGGSFGRRLEDDYVLQAVELAMAVKGRPVKMTWTREEDMTHDFPRPAQIARGRGTVREGRVEALDLSVVGQSVSASWLGRVMVAPPGPDTTIVAGAWDQPFAIPHYRVTGYRAPEMVPVSSWRSVGASANGFFHDCFLDELIHAAGADPLEERLRLCADPLSRKVLEAAAEMSGWSGPRISETRARGVAFCLSFGVPMAEVVEISRTEAGIRIDKVYAACEIGRVLDPDNFEAQVAGGILFGLGHAMNCELSYADHAPEQANFDSYPGMRLSQAPQIEVRGLENGDRIRGIGEPGVPPAAPALANAIFALTGQRIRELPLNRHVTFA